MDDLDDVSLPARLGNGMLKVIKMSLVIFNSTKRNDIYVTRAEVISGYIAESSSAEIDVNLKWKNRLAHVSKKGLHNLNKKSAFEKDVISKIPLYEYCTLGKQHRHHFNTRKHETTAVSNLWDPSSIITKGGNKYFLSWIDDFSRKFWIFLSN